MSPIKAQLFGGPGDGLVISLTTFRECIEFALTPDGDAICLSNLGHLKPTGNDLRFDTYLYHATTNKWEFTGRHEESYYARKEDDTGD